MAAVPLPTTRATRATTGNSRPRLFPMQEPGTVKPKKAAKKPTKANTTEKRVPAVKASKPVGVKKTAAEGAKKATPAVKAKAVVKKVEAAITAKPKAKATGTKRTADKK